MELEPGLIILILILIAALISLSLSLILHHLNRQCIRSLSPSSSASASVAAESRSFARIRVSPETAAISLIESLPRFTFSSVRRCSNSTPCPISGDSAICLSKFEPPYQLRLLLPCSHAFHVDCVDKWLISNITCPLCRSPVQTSDPDFLRALQASSSAPATADAGASAVSSQGSLRIEIGSMSRREVASEIGDHRTSQSLGSLE